jgi:hypothetical protein
MPIELTPDFVKSAINTRHPNSRKCEELAKKLEVHAKGLTPENLINERRPNESEETKKYRQKIYVPITKKAIGKVITSLSKIRRSEDWNIQYDSDKVPSQVTNGNRLEDYCELNYPNFTSISNWAFSELLKRSLIDANSVCAVILKSIPAEKNEYLKPEAEIFSSNQILDYVPGEYYALLSADVCTYKAGNNRIYEGKVYYIITDTQIGRYEERAGKGLEEVYIYDHNIGEVPVRKVGGVFFERKNNDLIQESRIADMVPFLDEAAREYSDLQAEIVQHVYSEKYIYINTECPTCKGHGISNEKDVSGNFKSCPTCNGNGKAKGNSPYGVHLINVTKIGENSAPTPPIGYINKSTEIPKLQDERIDGHIYKGLSAINMEFLSETPLNQSGTAKEVDRDELNNFVNSIAEDIVSVLDRVYYFICQYRYNVIVPDEEKRNAMLPVIPVPERFGLINSALLMQEIQVAKTSKANPVLVKNMEIEYARKKYNSEPNVAYELEAIFELDPFYGYEQADKMTMMSNGGISELDYIISCNIVQFVQRAVKENEDYLKLKFAEKKKIITVYAKEIETANSAKESAKTEITNSLIQDFPNGNT